MPAGQDPHHRSGCTFLGATVLKQMSSVGSFNTEHVAPFSTKYAQRISKIHEQRENQEKQKGTDVLHARAVIGSTFRVSSADQSRSYNADRTFGLVRPLSAGKSRSGSNSRSTSVERAASQPADTDIQRSIASFDKELQLQKDIAAKEKQKLALLQVKKESYINFLKNKGNTPWIPGGDGAKHATSTHKSINKSASEQRLQHRAWCRSPWPGQLAGDRDRDRADSGDSYGWARRDDRSDSSSQVPHAAPDSAADAWARTPNHQQSPNRVGAATASAQAARPAVSPQRIRHAPLTQTPLPTEAAASGRSRERGRSNSDAASVAASVGSSQVTGARRSGASASAASNSKYVALTVRIIDTAHPAQKSSYGVFIVPRNCTRLEMIGNIERQFNVLGQVSDIAITYRSGYSHGVTVASLSMGTLADVPQIDDYSSITIYLGGSTIFDSHGNITTNPTAANAAARRPDSTAHSTADLVPHATVLPSPKSAPVSSPNLASGASPKSAGLSPIGADGVASPTGLAVGDNLFYFDDAAEEASSVESAQESAAGSASVLSRGAGSVRTGDPQQTRQPVQVPLYEALHPDQPMHGFSYASPAEPLLGRGPAFTSPELSGSEYLHSSVAVLSTSRTAAPSVRSTGERTRLSAQPTGAVFMTNARDKPSQRPFQPSAAGYMFAEGEGEEPAAATPREAWVLSALPEAAPQPHGQHQRHRRDWLAEAEAQVRAERAGQPSVPYASALPLGRIDGPGSPAYRRPTSSSASRRSGRSLTPSDPRAQQDRIRDRSRGRGAAISLLTIDTGAQDTKGGLNSARSRSSSVDRARSVGGTRSSWERQLRAPLGAQSPQLSIRSTASSRGRSAFINTRSANELQEVNQRIFGVDTSSQTRPRSGSASSAGRFGEEIDRARDARDYSDYGDVAGATEGRRSNYAYSSFHGGMNMFMHGKVISRSSEELVGGEAGVDALRSGTPLVPGDASEGRVEQAQPAPMSYFASGIRAPMFLERGISDMSAAGSVDDLTALSHPRPAPPTSRDGVASGAPAVKGMGRQLSMNLDELLADMS